MASSDRAPCQRRLRPNCSRCSPTRGSEMLFLLMEPPLRPSRVRTQAFWVARQHGDLFLYRQQDVEFVPLENADRRVVPSERVLAERGNGVGLADPSREPGERQTGRVQYLHDVASPPE